MSWGDNIDPSLQYTWSRGYPQSCKCVETGVTSSECDLYKCTCSCDLSAGECDYSCCCDPDCSVDQIDRFRDNGVCSDEGYTPDSERVCYSSEELQKVNPRSPVEGKATSTDALDEMLCVEKKNKELKGNFYEEVGHPQDTSVFDESGGQKEYTYSTEDTVQLTNDGFYDHNDTIPAYNGRYSPPSSFGGSGYLPLPRPDFSGYCNDNNNAEFRNDASTMCLRKLGGSSNTEASFASQCEAGLVSTDTLVRNLLLASTPPATLGTPPAEYVSPVITSVMFLSPADENNAAVSTDVTSAWMTNNCSTGVESSSSNYDSSCQFGSNFSSNTICRNAIQSITFTVSHAQDSQSSIESVSVEFVVMDIVLSDSNGGAEFAQSFGILYNDTASASSISQVNGNQVKRYRSGNPGYRFGLPVLFGSLDSSNEVILAEESGLTVSTALPTSQAGVSTFGSALCPSELTIDNVEKEGVRFGYDLVSSCSLQLNRSSLRSFCCEGADLCDPGYSSVYSMSNGVPVYLDPVEGYIGAFGNADPLDVNQWFALSVDNPSVLVSNRRWTESSGVCSSMITGVNYKFLVTYAGEKGNPQNKIVSAMVEYKTSDVVMRAPVDDEVAEQPITLSITATFIFKENEDLKGYTPPPPPGLLTVPYDVFYPFNIGNSAPKCNRISLFSTFVLIAFATLVGVVYGN
eukprot:CAMPEP_0185036376 /NCGR_PEP_ID=MMETSP1103-20130426/29281_1 /TAXON_ID=36769 /ORGANISM="Paraphysomonas bandaiensis, Strain Caron Lab Isolate" /LENGTH=686 /DNA_ID=CAMNT_0027573895 /DNA_START=94 /DNA_END=2154 /DNA_ORIENTATION=+